MYDTSGRAPAVKPADAEAELSALKQRLIRHLEEAAAATEGGGLEPAEGVTLIIEDADGNPIQVERAHVEDGRLFVSGYQVEDPEDQCIAGEEAELNYEELGRLGAETLLSVVRHFAP